MRVGGESNSKPDTTCSMIFSGVGKARKKLATQRKANGLAMLSYLSVHLRGGCGVVG